MKKTVIVFGILSGIIATSLMLFVVISSQKTADFEQGMWMGYVTMVLSFAFIFAGIKSFRDKHNQGIVSFGKAFRTGLYISLIASTMYVLAWLIEYYIFFPDFMDKYAEHMMRTAQESGASPAKLKDTADTVANYRKMYQNPIMVILMTYAEILPLGIVAALISALILKRKTPKAGMVSTQY